jgi:hypothetical protein
MPKVTQKLVTPEYHEGQQAYAQGHALTTNPYLSGTTKSGALWYWMFGWQDALADDFRQIKQLLVSDGRPINKSEMN